MNNAEGEARRWYAQAENNLAFAKIGLREGFYAQACFVSQQAVEKALKAVHYARGERVVLGHSLWELLRGLLADKPKLATHRDLAKVLDQYYVPTRYPNGLPSGAPFEIFTESQAQAAADGAEAILTDLRALLPPGVLAGDPDTESDEGSSTPVESG